MAGVGGCPCGVQVEQVSTSGGERGRARAGAGCGGGDPCMVRSNESWVMVT